MEGSGDDFSKFSTVFGFVSSKWSLHGQNAENAKKAKNAKNAQPAQILPFGALGQVWVGGGVPPRGSSIKQMARVPGLTHTSKNNEDAAQL